MRRGRAGRIRFEYLPPTGAMREAKIARAEEVRKRLEAPPSHVWKLCQFCGEKYLGERRHVEQKYCSHSCHRKSVPRVEVPTITLLCHYCKTAFQRERNLIRKGRQFCSQACVGKQLASEAVVTYQFCPECGAQFRMKSPKRTYCGRACANRGGAKKRRQREEPDSA